MLDPAISREQFWVGRDPWPAGVYTTSSRCRSSYKLVAHRDPAVVVERGLPPIRVRPGDWVVTLSDGTRIVTVGTPWR